MEERNARFEELVSELSAYMVMTYGIESRDAAALVMNSPVTQQLYESGEAFDVSKIEELAEQYTR